MSEIQTIIVGSQNPVKINAALVGFNRMFAEQSFVAEGLSVESGVSDQPMTATETLAGATQRAKAVRQANPNADFAVGIEGGIDIINGQMFAGAWIVVVGKDGRQCRGRSGSFALPAKVQELVESGMELGHANDEYFDEHNSKQSGGAVGSLTGGVISRQDLYEHAMVLALSELKQRRDQKAAIG